MFRSQSAYRDYLKDLEMTESYASSSFGPPRLRKTRFVCVSDTHNQSPLTGAFKLPKGDVLIHAGDLTKQGNLSELRRQVEWIEKADFEVKIVIAGSHSTLSLQSSYIDCQSPNIWVIQLISISL
jgi:Calcineurin-like phosphoesterase